MINQGIEDRLILQRRKELVHEADNFRLANQVEVKQGNLQSILDWFKGVRKRSDKQLETMKYPKSKVSTQTAYTV